jgi:hypothetical protein
LTSSVERVPRNRLFRASLVPQLELSVGCPTHGDQDAASTLHPVKAQHSRRSLRVGHTQGMKARKAEQGARQGTAQQIVAHIAATAGAVGGGPSEGVTDSRQRMDAGAHSHCRLVMRPISSGSVPRSTFLASSLTTEKPKRAGHPTASVIHEMSGTPGMAWMAAAGRWVEAGPRCAHCLQARKSAHRGGNRATQYVVRQVPAFSQGERAGGGCGLW